MYIDLLNPFCSWFFFFLLFSLFHPFFSFQFFRFAECLKIGFLFPLNRRQSSVFHFSFKVVLKWYTHGWLVIYQIHFSRHFFQFKVERKCEAHIFLFLLHSHSLDRFYFHFAWPTVCLFLPTYIPYVCNGVLCCLCDLIPYPRYLRHNVDSSLLNRCKSAQTKCKHLE